MSIETTMNSAPANRPNVLARFGDWAFRTLARLPANFEDVDPKMLRIMLPF